MPLSDSQRRALFESGKVTLKLGLQLDEYIQCLYDGFTPDEQADIVIEIMSSFDQEQLTHVREWLLAYD